MQFATDGGQFILALQESEISLLRAPAAFKLRLCHPNLSLHLTFWHASQNITVFIQSRFLIFFASSFRIKVRKTINSSSSRSVRASVSDCGLAPHCFRAGGEERDDLGTCTGSYRYLRFVCLAHCSQLLCLLLSG